MNIYPDGQCTWECADVAPWCLRYGNLGDAHNWALAWSSSGGMVGSVPLVGAVVCFQPGVEGAGPVGHVAVVTATDGAAFSVVEMDFPNAGGVSHRSGLAVVPGVSFLLEGVDMWKQLLADDDFALSEVLKAHLLVSAAYGHINPGETFPATGQDEANEIAALRARGLAQFITYLKNVEIGTAPGPA